MRPTAFPSSAGSARSVLRSSTSNRMYASSDMMAMTHAVCPLYAGGWTVRRDRAVPRLSGLSQDSTIIAILSPPARSNRAFHSIDPFRPSHDDIGNLPSPPKRINYQDIRITPSQRSQQRRRNSPENPSTSGGESTQGKKG